MSSTVLRPPTPDDFTSRLRSPAVAARVGLWLGISFGICFLTGLVSHYAQNLDQPVAFPTAPAWGYRLTQGTHVISGIVAIPLLLVKLWAVFPRLFESFPFRDPRAMLLTGLERASIAVLVASAIFQLATGLLNTTQWYPYAFSFRSTHYAVAWIAIGALIVHIVVKLPVIRDALTSDVEDTTHDRASATRPGALSRRGLLRTTWGAAAVAAVATAGSTVPALRKVSIFGWRTGEGPQGVPINRSAAAAQVTVADGGPAWRLDIISGGTTTSWSRAELEAMEQRTETLPIACVEGWSASGEWGGVRLRDLLDQAGAPAGSDVLVRSLQRRFAFGVSLLQGNFADDDRTLLALRLNGEDISLDHGYPVRLIAPNRPGVLQTKWLTSMEVMS